MEHGVYCSVPAMKEPSFSVAASTGVFAAALAALYVMLTESLILIHIVSRIRATQQKELQHIVNRDSWNRLPQEFSPKKTVARYAMNVLSTGSNHR